MKKLFWIMGVAVLMIGTAARADWNVGDDYKMHYPQLPDPMGWDIDVVTDWVYDDFQCSASGAITDVHFWVSYRQDIIAPIAQVLLEIWSDVPRGLDPNPNVTWSHPGGKLWEGFFVPGQFIMGPTGTGEQGWVSPSTSEPDWIRPDHLMYQQINIPLIPQPFMQQEGQIYWLGIHIIPAGTNNLLVGWKTSLQHFNDDAVYYYGGQWHELIDPRNGASLDMAFVITPEPTSIALLAAGGLTLLRRRHH